MVKKTSIIVVISIVIIAISLLISIYIPNKHKIENKTEDNSMSYYLLKENEKFGVINLEGDVVIKPQYEEIIIPNIHKPVFVCREEDKNIILNNKNEEILKQYKNVQPLQLTNIIAESAYEKNVLIYEDNGKFGLIGLNGEIIVEAKYEEISSLGYKEGEILVKEDNKYGIINDRGYQLIKSNYDSITSDQFYSEKDGYKKSGYIVCNITDEGYRYGYYDFEGSKMLDTEYNQVIRLAEVSNTDNIYLIVAKNGQYGVFINNNKIINTQYQSITYDKIMQMYIVERTGQYGAINEKGMEIIKTEYSEIEINGIYMYTKKEEEQKVFDKTGKEIDIPSNITIEATGNPEYYIKIEKNGEEEKYSILNANMEKVLEQEYSYIENIFDKYFIAINEQNKSGVIDIEGKIIVDFKYDLLQTLKGKNIIQASDYTTGMTELYNNELKKVIQMNEINIQLLSEYIKVYNENEEYYLDNNGNKIENEEHIKAIKESNAVLRIKNFKRVTYGVEQYYYVEDDVN
ncbi:MAG: WG repeat-containing protein [Clostridia bacterium]|nr:WG repeat-containing protein [Clostridia bacterium]